MISNSILNEKQRRAFEKLGDVVGAGIMKYATENLKETGFCAKCGLLKNSKRHYEYIQAVSDELLYAQSVFYHVFVCSYSAVEVDKLLAVKEAKIGWLQGMCGEKDAEIKRLRKEIQRLMPEHNRNAWLKIELDDLRARGLRLADDFKRFRKHIISRAWETEEDVQFLKDFDDAWMVLRGDKKP